MKIRTVRMCQDPACADVPPHEDDHGTRFFGVPAWVYCFLIVMAAAVAMLAYTASVR